jgi:hypothetical protein
VDVLNAMHAEPRDLLSLPVMKRQKPERQEPETGSTAVSNLCDDLPPALTSQDAGHDMFDTFEVDSNVFGELDEVDRLYIEASEAVAQADIVAETLEDADVNVTEAAGLEEGGVLGPADGGIAVDDNDVYEVEEEGPVEGVADGHDKGLADATNEQYDVAEESDGEQISQDGLVAADSVEEQYDVEEEQSDDDMAAEAVTDGRKPVAAVVAVAPELAVPESAGPESAGPESALPESALPELDASELDASELDASELALHEPTGLEPAGPPEVVAASKLEMVLNEAVMSVNAQSAGQCRYGPLCDFLCRNFCV